MDTSRPAAPTGVAGLAASGLAAIVAALLVTGAVVTGTTPGLPPAAASEAVARPHIEGPPPAHTGGFGEPTCLECHLGAELNEPGSTLEVLGLGTAYRPGQTLTVTIRLVSFEMASAGFQGSFRFAEGPRRGRRAGEVRPLDGRVAVVGGPSGDTRYVQHTRTGAATRGQVAEWTFEWRAPRAGESVVFHVAANSGSGDDSPLDDLVYTSSVTLRSGSER